MLRKRCHEAHRGSYILVIFQYHLFLCIGNKIADEVRRIMGPRQSVSYSPAADIFSSSNVTEIPRRPKRKGKYQLAVGKYGSNRKKARSSAATFQKKLYVFKYMGSKAPNSFTRSDKDIVTRGLLPQISVSATEDKVRNEICQVVRSCTIPILSEIGPKDFHFINLAGKQASVPSCKEGFEWNGRAVKELAGSGAVYIRLTKPSCISSDSSSSDSELVSYLESTATLTPPASVSITTPAVSFRALVTSDSVTPREPVTPAPVTHREPVTPAPDTSREPVIPAPVTHREPVTPASITPREPVTPASVILRELVTPVPVTPREPVTPASTSLFVGGIVAPDNDASITIDDDLSVDASFLTAEDSVIILDDNHSNSSLNDFRDEVGGKSNLTRLAEMFPHITSKQLAYIYNLSGSSLSRVVECMLEGPTFESILGVATSQRSTDDSPRIRLERSDGAEDWTEAALAFYKQGRFDKAAGMRIHIRGQPAIDAGGVRRQFFSVVFTELARTESHCSLFEGPSVKLRPVFKASILSSGVLSTVGTMVAHSLLLDGLGFPYLAEFCYYYIAGCYDQAVTCVTVDDVGMNVKSLIEKVK